MKNTLILFLLFLQNTLFAQADVAKKIGFTTFFIENKGKKIECIIADLDLSNLEHNYLKLDKNGKILERHWQDVLDDVVKWLKSKKNCKM